MFLSYREQKAVMLMLDPEIICIFIDRSRLNTQTQKIDDVTMRYVRVTILVVGPQQCILCVFLG